MRSAKALIGARKSIAANNVSNLVSNTFQNEIDDCKRLLNASSTLDVDDGTKPVFMDLNGTSANIEKQSECLRLLRKHTLFKYVAPKLLLKLARSAKEKVLEEGTELFTIGKRIEFPNL